MSLSAITFPRRFAPFGPVSALVEHSDAFSSLFGDLSKCVIPTEETPEAYILTLPLPGFRREDVTIQVAHEANDEAEATIVAVRGAKRIERFVNLGALQVNTDAISAKLEDGLLTLTCPKLPVSKPRVIPVT